MPRQSRENNPQSDRTDMQAHIQVGHNANPEWLLTFRIEQEPLLLSNVARILTAITQLHAKLWLIEQHPDTKLVDYAVTETPELARMANLTAVSITQNSPLTVVVMVSEAVGKALASLIDAVSQSRIRYDRAKLDLEQSKVEGELKAAQIQMMLWQKADEHQVKMRERVLQLQSQLIELKSQELSLRDAEINTEMNIRTRSVEVARRVVSGLHPTAPQEIQETMIRTVTNDLWRLSGSEGIVVDSFKPQE